MTLTAYRWRAVVEGVDEALSAEQAKRLVSLVLTRGGCGRVVSVHVEAVPEPVGSEAVDPKESDDGEQGEDRGQVGEESPDRGQVGGGDHGGA